MSDAINREMQKMAIEMAARIVTETAFDLIYYDSHQFSTRPCQTCEAITTMTGIAFGCSRKRKEKSK